MTYTKQSYSSYLNSRPALLIAKGLPQREPNMWYNGIECDYAD
jgi:hypothetical protein